MVVVCTVNLNLIVYDQCNSSVEGWGVLFELCCVKLFCLFVYTNLEVVVRCCWVVAGFVSVIKVSADNCPVYSRCVECGGFFGNLSVCALKKSVCLVEGEL